MNRGRNILSLSAIQKIMFRLLVIFLLFGCKKLELERTVMVATGSVTNVSYASCSVQGTIIDKGEKGIDQHGFCWAVTQNPTTANNKTQLGSKSSTGSFSDNLTGLSTNTTYYVRAYAQNKDGVFYGDQKSFTTTALSSPTVATTPISNITENSAQSGGNVTDDGGTTITTRGVCWNTSQNPTISNDHTNDGSGTGSFTSSLTGLTQKTKYYVRAYATNGAGTAYGNEISFLTLSLPTVTTSPVINTTDNSAQSGGNVTDDGGTTVTARGVCWNTSQNPTITDDHTTDGSGTGSFTSSLTGLTQNITYYVRAYATNSVGTGYGQQVVLRTYNGTVTDFEGNVYYTVNIGSQTWMAENLKTTKYNDGTAIPLVTDNTTWINLTTPGYCWYDNNEANYKNTYGALYNWYTVNIGKLCPTGWHVPTDAEWSTLIDYLGGESVAGGKLKETGTIYWNSPNTGATNETGFKALPGGLRSVAFYDIGYYGRWWSATEQDAASAWIRVLANGNGIVFSSNNGKSAGFSVRCLRD
ncbi:MAG: fibrobacter succinogenes major paralogous domain-containing protein [Bacteroidales bacterium]|nr:fibrobacter succinogenes major paralogous domain-containing protein [Bacteroidales bacterium]